jgi:hypothetical protein
MKTDFYTKTILTVIAICLTINVLKDFDFIPKAYATENNKTELNMPTNKNYGLVPLNTNGTIDVNIKSCDSWALQWAFGTYPVPVEIQN